jgi:hypothetical protein
MQIIFNHFAETGRGIFASSSLPDSAAKVEKAMECA